MLLDEGPRTALNALPLLVCIRALLDTELFGLYDGALFDRRELYLLFIELFGYLQVMVVTAFHISQLASESG
jgi:hypothetical protein